ncbi:putative Helix-turn-helix-domain containing protein AraC type [Hyphomicrobium sp. MC1]|nr:AraC family transcriptional regulator [Hyphomicrobium sp. MC1]CCB64966.1 putative Helix-turn-helix-domain containing protein AraC type [Hyphomicrobium sp. MC1]
MSNLGEVRVGPIMAIPAVLREFGVKPQRAFSVAGIDPRIFQNPDNRIPLEEIGRLLEVCIELTGCGHFGVLVGERFDLRSFGALGCLLRNSASVGDALRSLVLHLHVHDRGAAPVLLAPHPSKIILGYSVYRSETPAIPQIYDAAIAIAYKILQELCGPAWKPQTVQFSYRRPSNIEPYRRIFQSPVRFGAEVSGIVFPAFYLQRPISDADPSLHDILVAAMENAANGRLSLSEKVQEVLPQMVLGGTSAANVVARLFDMPERTLRRRLATEGKNLQHLVQQARFELAQQMLKNTERPVTGIAASLRYEDANAFSRAFRKWAGVSPQQWRLAACPA